MTSSRPPGIVILHIPHSSRHVPPKERQSILLDDAELSAELLRMTDAYTDELFPLTPVEAGRVVFPVSRLVCDVERFSSDWMCQTINKAVGDGIDNCCKNDWNGA
jgi:N-formylglutamate amidohydrolase